MITGPLAEDVGPFMARALRLAQQARVACPPNPAVGCVVVDAAGAVLGEGFTQPVGQAHAEVMALRDAAARGHDTRGATAYVTLEPCAHHGRTGPCCDALIAAGVRTVVAAVEDPNPKVRGAGFARLRAAGVAVHVGEGAAQSREMNAGFFVRMTRGTPWLRVKVGSSIDGRTALPNGQSQWITSAAAREDVQWWRARSCAVMTGIGTVLADDPLLTARGPHVTRQPALVVVDSRLRTPVDARLWQQAPRMAREVIIYTAAAESARLAAMAERGAEVAAMPTPQGQVDLRAVVHDLGRRGFNEVLVEAGERLVGALVTADLVDELLLYQAAVLLGAGAGIAHLAPLARVGEARRWGWIAADPVGPDMRMRARPLPSARPS